MRFIVGVETQHARKRGETDVGVHDFHRVTNASGFEIRESDAKIRKQPNTKREYHRVLLFQSKTSASSAIDQCSLSRRGYEMARENPWLFLVAY